MKETAGLDNTDFHGVQGTGGWGGAEAVRMRDTLRRPTRLSQLLVSQVLAGKLAPIAASQCLFHRRSSRMLGRK